ncbi:MAG: TIGR04076 family protein [Clostridia bacterium]|nr:TIGR04076 family protein [Clostridia bacterium]
MAKVKLTITESRCRCGYVQQGQVFVVEDLCPPLCHELWNAVYPYVFALQNGAELDCGTQRAKAFTAKCPDEGRVSVRGEVIADA